MMDRNEHDVHASGMDTTIVHKVSRDLRFDLPGEATVYPIYAGFSVRAPRTTSLPRTCLMCGASGVTRKRCQQTWSLSR
jgi:hypothetical protein